MNGLHTEWQRSSHSLVAMEWTRYSFSDSDLGTVYISLIQDRNWVNYMARADNATQMRNEEAFAVVLELPEELRRTSERPQPSSVALAARDKFVKTIRGHIANNRAVIVKACCFSQCRGFSIEDIGMVRPSMSHSVYWQGMCTRNLNR